jgi:hypothetical protein
LVIDTIELHLVRDDCVALGDGNLIGDVLTIEADSFSVRKSLISDAALRVGGKEARPQEHLSASVNC